MKKNTRNNPGAILPVLLLICMALALMSACALQTPTQSVGPTPEPTIHPPVTETPAPWAPPEASTFPEAMTAMPVLTDPGPGDAKEEAPEPAQQQQPILPSVPLDAATQRAVYELCDDDNGLYCALMAIARVESNFDASAVGDGGRCVGMMQISYALHAARIARLGVTDLYDPIQSATVAIDYIKEIARGINATTDDHALYMSYNMGPAGARAKFDEGVYSTAYSRLVMGYYDGYMAEMENLE